MNMKQFLKDYLIILILAFIVFLLFFPICTEYKTNYNIYHSIIDLGFADYGLFSALIVGLLSFTATIYTTNKNLNIAKLSSTTENTLELIIKIENAISYQKLEKKLSSYDKILSFIKIVRIAFTYESEFKLIYPKVHKDLMDFIFKDAVLNFNSKIPEKNAQTLIMNIKLRLLDEVRDNKRNTKLKDSKLCTDDAKFCNVDKEISVNFNTEDLLNYIENINGPKSKKYAKKEFEEFNKFIDNFIKRLDEETKKIMDIQ